MNEYSPKVWLTLEIFAVIFVFTMLRSSLPVVTNLPNSTALHAHWYNFHVFGGTNFSLMNEDDIFCEFLFSRF